MNFRLPAALLCSVCLHLLAVMVLLVLHHGNAAGVHAASHAPAAAAQRPGMAVLLQQSVPDKELLPSSVPAPAFPAPGAAAAQPAASLSNTPRAPQTEELTYVPDTLLTKPPVPLDGIDLHVPALDDAAAHGPIKLTLRIDAHGKVTDIRLADGHPPGAHDMEMLAELAERFAKLRFSPGEMDGFPVNAELHIAIATDDATQPASPASP